MGRRQRSEKQIETEIDSRIWWLLGTNDHWGNYQIKQNLQPSVLVEWFRIHKQHKETSWELIE